MKRTLAGLTRGQMDGWRAKLLIMLETVNVACGTMCHISYCGVWLHIRMDNVAAITIPFSMAYMGMCHTVPHAPFPEFRHIFLLVMRG